MAYLTLMGIARLSDVAGYTLGNILASHHAQLVEVITTDLVCVCVSGDQVKLLRAEIARDVPRVQTFDVLVAAA